MTKKGDGEKRTAGTAIAAQRSLQGQRGQVSKTDVPGPLGINEQATLIVRAQPLARGVCRFHDTNLQAIK